MLIRRSLLLLFLAAVAGCENSEGPIVPPAGSAANLPAQSEEAKVREKTSKFKINPPAGGPAPTAGPASSTGTSP